MFKQGTYVTNGDVRGIVRGYSDNKFWCRILHRPLQMV